MDPSKFYSKKYENKTSKIEKKLEQGAIILKTNPLPVDIPKSLFGPSPEWRVFKKQEDALRFQNDVTGLMTFAFEERLPNNEGRRHYLVTHPRNLFRQHVQTLPEKRCTYEVIPESAPCKLYFDLEFSKELNPERNPEAMVESFNQAMIWAIKEEFGIHLSQSNILVLDASTTSKFSQHLIYQFPEGVAFRNNRHAGEFVKHTCQQIIKKDIPCISNENLNSLLIDTGKESANSALFCDLGVYTKNRNFRLYLSTKFGKNAPFVLAKNNCYKPQLSDITTEDEAIFFSSLISYFPTAPTRLLAFGSSEPTKIKLHSNNSNVQKTELGGYSYSPWPRIDDFVNNLVLPGRTRRWIYYEHTDSLVFEITGNRYCSNIGRWHKSNNVKYVVNVKNLTYYQSCFDPECRDFRSDLQQIPTFVNSSSESAALFEEDDVSDEILAEIADITEFFACQ